MRAPLRPSQTARHTDSRVLPTDVIIPIPVITIGSSLVCRRNTSEVILRRGRGGACRNGNGPLLRHPCRFRRGGNVLHSAKFGNRNCHTNTAVLPQLTVRTPFKKKFSPTLATWRETGMMLERGI